VQQVYKVLREVKVLRVLKEVKVQQVHKVLREDKVLRGL
jgi:hypothetical protein